MVCSELYYRQKIKDLSLHLNSIHAQPISQLLNEVLPPFNG